jgi:hypothetical protein
MQEYETIIEKHYPIIWWIEGNQILIQNKKGKTIYSDHIIYQREIDFIQNQICEMTFRGEICS